MSSHKERFADKMELPPATPQPNIYPLSWNSKTKKLQEVWEASLREAGFSNVSLFYAGLSFRGWVGYA